jgi:hypothetical protein
MRIRNYKIDADDKRHMRRLYPEVAFDWKKITQQLAEKREACRRYRSRRRSPDTASHSRGSEPLFYGVYKTDPRTVYVNDVPSQGNRVKKQGNRIWKSLDPSGLARRGTDGFYLTAYRTRSGRMAWISLLLAGKGWMTREPAMPAVTTSTSC